MSGRWKVKIEERKDYTLGSRIQCKKAPRTQAYAKAMM